MEKVSLEVNEEQLPIQIFPDPLENVDECCRRLKGHLPLIVVEPTDTNEVESGELRWPPNDLSSFEDVENFFEASCEIGSAGDPEPSETAPLGEAEAKEKTAEAKSDDVIEVVSLPCDNREAARRD